MSRALLAFIVIASLISIGIFIMFMVYAKMINDKYKEMCETLNSVIEKINDLSTENDKVTETLDHNNRKYESQFNDIWHRIARADEPLDPAEVNESVHQYFNMLDNMNIPRGAIECVQQDSTGKETKSILDETGLTITSKADNSVNEAGYE